MSITSRWCARQITRACRCRRPSASAFDIRNAAGTTIRGVELEHSSRLGRGFQAGGHVTWLDATYDNYIAVNNNVAGDVSGNRLNNAPEWAGRLWVEWSGDIGPSRRLSIVADATAQSTVYYTPFNDNIQVQGPYGLLGARVEYGPTNRRWALAAYARNFTNTDYITATFGTSPVAFGGVQDLRVSSRLSSPSADKPSRLLANSYRTTLAGFVGGQRGKTA